MAPQSTLRFPAVNRLWQARSRDGRGRGHPDRRRRAGGLHRGARAGGARSSVRLITTPRRPIGRGAVGAGAAGARGERLPPGARGDRAGGAARGELERRSSAANREWVVARAAFDAALLEDAAAAGVEIVHGRIAGSARSAAGWTLEAGRGQRLRKQLSGRGARPAGAGHGGCAGLRPPRSAGCSRACLRRREPRSPALPRLGLVRLDRRRPGRLADRAGVRAPLPGRRGLRRSSSAAATRSARRAGSAGGRGSARSSPAMPRPAVRLCRSNNRLIRVGDAALAMDPLSGHGVFEAIASAKAAVPVVNTMLRRPDDAALARAFYEERVRLGFERFARIGRDFYALERRSRSRSSGANGGSGRTTARRTRRPGPPRDRARPVVEDGFIVARAVAGHAPTSRAASGRSTACRSSALLEWRRREAACSPTRCPPPPALCCAPQADRDGAGMAALPSTDRLTAPGRAQSSGANGWRKRGDPMARALAGTGDVAGRWRDDRDRAGSGDGEAVLNARCAACHERTAEGGLARIKDQRKTPEAWDMTIARMMHMHGVEVTRRRAPDAGQAPGRHAGARARPRRAGFRYILEREPGGDRDRRRPRSSAPCARAATPGRGSRCSAAPRRSGASSPTSTSASGRRPSTRRLGATATGGRSPRPSCRRSSPSCSRWRRRRGTPGRRASRADCRASWRFVGREPGRGDYEGAVTIESTGNDTTRLRSTAPTPTAPQIERQGQRHRLHRLRMALAHPRSARTQIAAGARAVGGRQQPDRAHRSSRTPMRSAAA